MVARIKFASQADPELLNGIKEIAKEEGRQFQAVIEDALIYFLENRKHRKVRASVLGHFNDSVIRNHRMGELLAQ